MEGKWSQAEAPFPWHHDHCHSRETKAGRAVGVLVTFLIRKKWWEVFKVSVCLYLTWLKDDESQRPPNLLPKNLNTTGVLPKLSFLPARAELGLIPPLQCLYENCM